MSLNTTHNHVKGLLADPDTDIYGIIGDNLVHTLSPKMHNVACVTLGLNAVYLAFPMERSRIEPFLDLAWALGWQGFNVTVPYKEVIADIMVKRNPTQTKISATNTLFREQGADFWSIASTDGPGFAEGLTRIKVRLNQFDRAVFLGAGGAVVSLIEYFSEKAPQIKDIHVFRRSDKADEKIKKVAKNTLVHFHEFKPATLQKVLVECRVENTDSKKTIIIQATSAPIRGDDLSRFVPAMEGFTGAFVDLVYGKPSALYSKAVALGLRAQDGESMLIEQARLSQQFWWKKSLDYELMRLALRPRLG